MTIRSPDARIGERIRMLRQKRDIPPSALAEALELSVSAYEAREEGTLSFSARELNRLAETLGVTLDDLFAGMVASPEDRASKRH